MGLPLLGGISPFRQKPGSMRLSTGRSKKQFNGVYPQGSLGRKLRGGPAPVPILLILPLAEQHGQQAHRGLTPRPLPEAHAPVPALDVLQLLLGWIPRY